MVSSLLRIGSFVQTEIVVATILLSLFIGTTTSRADTTLCTSAEQIQAAFSAAQPGDVIRIAPGTYTGTKQNVVSNIYPYFHGTTNGTKAAPIRVESTDADNPAILQGNGATINGYGLYITGDHWHIHNIVVTKAKKGIMLDNANYCVLKGISVHDVGEEAIHVRDGSSNNWIDSCFVSNTGLSTPGYGEGVYVGSDKGKWEKFAKECDSTRITRCTIGPGVTAEHIDVKEGSSFTLIEHCVFEGAGISGANSAGSFVDIKGNDVIVRNCIGYRRNNSAIVAAFEIHQQVQGWAVRAHFETNTVYLDAPDLYIVDNPYEELDATAKYNTRFPEGLYYRNVNDISSLPENPLSATSVSYYAADANEQTKSIKPNLLITNGGSWAVPLEIVSIRYFFTADGHTPQAQSLRHVSEDILAFVNQSIGFDATKQSAYLQISFNIGAGSLQPGTTLELRATIAGENYGTFEQTNDESFSPHANSYQPTEAIALIHNAALLSKQPLATRVFLINQHRGSAMPTVNLLGRHVGRKASGNNASSIMLRSRKSRAPGYYLGTN